MLSDNRRKEIRVKAEAFRERCKVSRYGIIDLFKECDRCGFKLLRYPLGETADLGFAMKRDQDVILFTNTSIRLSREIFTLAHEIGHIQLHIEDMEEERSREAFIDDTITIAGRSIDDKEQEGTTITVTNNKGSTLPSTGGMGTTILYIVGAVLVIGAGVVLFTKRRMSN